MIINTCVGNFTADKSYIISQLLAKSILPIVLFLGLLGNTITCIVLIRLRRKNISTASQIYFFALALTDAIVMSSGLLRLWVSVQFCFDIRAFTDFGCKFHLFLLYTLMQLSSWILVSVNVQRCLMIKYPLKISLLWNGRRSLLQLSVTFLILSLINIHFFKTNGLKSDWTCGSLTEEYRHFKAFFFVYVDFAVLCIIPFLCMLIGTIYISASLKRADKWRNNAIARENKLLKKGRIMAKTIIFLNILFLFTTLPICVYFVVDSYLRFAKNGPVNVDLDLARTICELIQYIGYALNIVLYSMQGENFRDELKDLFNVRLTRLLRGK